MTPGNVFAAQNYKKECLLLLKKSIYLYLLRKNILSLQAETIVND
jgi:hypothetical protein